jgi:RNA polymerase sigma-70 factor (ECF subfamily)
VIFVLFRHLQQFAEKERAKNRKLGVHGTERKDRAHGAFTGTAISKMLAQMTTSPAVLKRTAGIGERAQMTTSPGEAKRTAGGRGNDSRDLERKAIAATKAGNWDGLSYLYSRYSDDVQRFIQSIVHDRHESEDITQDVFTKLITKIRKYEERDVPFAAWIMRVARNAALDHLRSRRQIPVDEVWISEDDRERTAVEYTHALKDALAELPDSQRQVLVLRHIGGLSPTEIAKRLGKSEGSIHGLHHRGRAALKVSLEDRGVAPVTAASAL